MKHEIIIYMDARGRAPLRDYLKELKIQKGDDSRIRISKIQDYISLLQEKVPLSQSQYASIFQIKSIRGYGNFARVVIVYYSLHGQVVRLFFFMHSEKKARKHRRLNCVKQNVSIRTGWKGMVIYE